MKMSRSIKDYKKAMDGIRISESFHARAEALLENLPEDGEANAPVYVKKPVFTGRHITAVFTAAAACAVFVFGVRLALGSGGEDISAPEIVTVTVSSDEYATEAEADAADLIDDLDENAMSDIPVDITPDEVTKISEGGRVSPPQTAVTTAKPSGKVTKPASETVTTVTTVTTATTVTTVTTVTAAENNAPALDGGAEPATDEPNNAAGGYDDEVYDDDEDIDEEIEEDEVDDEEDESVDNEYEPEIPAADAEDAAVDEPLFTLPSLEKVTVTVTGGGETVTKKGGDCKELMELIEKLSTSPETRDTAFTPLYTVTVTENGRAVYTIYITDRDTIVIDGARRAAIALSVENSESLLKTLQNTF